jgi:site-specific DNA-methyltransferase (adenine-specific)/modification methylase
MTKNKDLLNKITQGDCLKIMKSISDNSIDMVLCDLPYGTTQNKWDSVIPLDKLWKEYNRIVKPNGAIVLTSQGVFTAKLILSNEKMFKYKIVWEKSKPTNFLNAKKQPLRKHEDVCVFYKKQPLYVPQMKEGTPYNKGVRKNQLSGSYGDFKPVEVKSEGKRYPTDIVYFKTAESEGEVFHPTQKPIELGRYFIKTFTKENEVILDNTCGSGSFMVAAVLEGRNFIGIELNEDSVQFKNKETDFIKVCNDRIDWAIKERMSNRLEELLQKSSKKPSKKRLEEIKNGIAKLSVSMLGSAEVDNYLIQELEC